MPLLGPDSDSARLLLMLMQQMSEDYWCAGWLTNLEHDLWEGRGISAVEYTDLCSVAHRAHGWWAWSDEVGAPRFVSLDNWRAQHKQFEAARERGDV